MNDLNDASNVNDAATTTDDLNAVRLAEVRTQKLQHQKLGWTTLFVFAIGGLALEIMHGFKVAAFLDVGFETRRLLFRLAHAHGTLLGLLHLALASSLPTLPRHHVGLAGRCLTSATFLLPAGFFLGGLNPRGGDPGLGVLLVPPGAFLLLLALGLLAKSSFAAVHGFSATKRSSSATMANSDTKTEQESPRRQNSSPVDEP